MAPTVQPAASQQGTAPSRVQPRCRHHAECGGCLWQDRPYPQQLQDKQATLQALLREALGSGAPMVAPAAAEAVPWAYRGKVHFVCSPGPGGRGLVMGHFRRGSHAVVPIDECPVHADAGNRVAFVIRDVLRAVHAGGASRDLTRGAVRHVVVRASRRTGETLATLVVTHNAPALKVAARRIMTSPGAPDGLHLNVHDRPGPFLFGRTTRRLAGVERVREEVAGASFVISPTAFFQTNVDAAERMARVVLGHLAGAGRVLDLYAGTGLFSLPIARSGAAVVAVESSREAVEDGDISRRLNRVSESTCRFVNAAAEDVAAGRHGRAVPRAPDAVVLDPPRSGCAPSVLAWVARDLRPAVVAYVSCNPEALAADARALAALRYRATHVEPVDMFPHTPHIESVAVFRPA